MGWTWDYSNKSWGNKQANGSWGKGQPSKPKAKSWGLWRCECGNSQAGSQCKHCGKKWWEVEWTKAEAPAATTDKPAKQTAKPPQCTQDIIGFLDTFLAHKPQQGEDLHAMANLHIMAAGLRDGIAGTEFKVSKGNRLKSVIDKLAFKKTAMHSLKGKPKQAQQELEDMEKQHDTLATEVASLEEERTELANLMANQPDTDSEGEQEEAPPSAADHPMGAQAHWAPKAKAKPRAQGDFGLDLTRLPQEDLDGFQQCVKQEAKRRRVTNSQSSSNPTEDDDEEEDDSKMRDGGRART